MGTPVVGSQVGKLAIDDAGTAAASFTTAYEFTSESLAARRTFLDLSGFRGSLSHPKERCRVGTYTVGGAISMNPTPTELDGWLKRIMGTAKSGSTFALADVGPMEFAALIDRGSKVLLYDGCKTAKATFSSQAGGPLTLTVDIVGATETIGNSGTFPSITPELADPYVHMDTVLTLGGTAYAAKQVDITVEYQLETDRFLNSLYVTALPCADRKVTVRVMLPWTTDEVALYNQALAGGTGSVVYTNGGTSVTFSFANLKAMEQTTPTLGSTRGELTYDLTLTAYTSSTTKELIVTTDVSE
jgi:hypothetical protein